MFAACSPPGRRPEISIPYLRAMTNMTTFEPERTDCPECGAAGSLVEFFCEVCYAELDEAIGEPGSPAAQRLSR